MKQIKCKSCGKIWYLDDGVENDLKVCPFCESAVKKKQKIEGTKNLGEAIYYALSERGIDMLASVGKITGFMYDTVPELRKEIKIFAKTFDEDYLAQYREAFSQDTRAISVTLNRLRENFIEEEGLSEAWADMLCTNCYQAIMFYRGEGLPEVLSIEITDYKSEQGVVTYVKKKNDNISASKVIPHTDTTSPYRGEKKVKCPVCSFEYSEDESGENRCPICNTPYKHAIKNSTSIPQKTIAAVGDNNKTQKTIVPTGDLSLDEILEGISSVSGYLKNWECNEANYPVDSPEWICEKAKCHYFGKHYCGKDENKAVKLFRQAANMHQFVPAYDYLGEFFLRKRDFQNSYKWYKKAADKNDAEALCVVGYFYHEGYAGLSKSWTNAHGHYEKAARTGEFKAALSVACQLMSGTRLPKSIDAAIEIIECCAVAGSPEGKCMLAALYWEGLGKTCDKKQAIQLLNESSKLGCKEAEVRLLKYKGQLSITERIAYAVL